MEYVAYIFEYLNYFLILTSLGDFIYSIFKKKDFYFSLNEHSLKKALLEADSAKMQNNFSKASMILENIFKNYPDNIKYFIEYVRCYTKNFSKSFIKKYNDIDFELLDKDIINQDENTILSYLFLKFNLKNLYSNNKKRKLYLITILIYYSFLIGICVFNSLFFDKILPKEFNKSIFLYPLFSLILFLFIAKISTNKYIKISLLVILYILNICVFSIVLLPTMNNYFLTTSLSDGLKIFLLLSLSLPSIVFLLRPKDIVHITLAQFFSIFIMLLLILVLGYLYYGINLLLSNWFSVDLFIIVLTSSITAYLLGLLVVLSNYSKTPVKKYTEQLCSSADEDICCLTDNMSHLYNSNVKDFLLQNTWNLETNYLKNLYLNTIDAYFSTQQHKELYIDNLFILPNCEKIYYRNYDIKIKNIMLCKNNSNFFLKNKELYLKIEDKYIKCLEYSTEFDSYCSIGNKNF